MSILIKINSVTRSDIIQDSIAWEQALTKDPSILSFDIRNSGTSLPSLGDTVELSIGGVVQFTGTITNKDTSIDRGVVERVRYEAKDGFYKFDRRLVVKAYTNQSASDIVEDIIANFTDGFTDTNVVAGAPTITTIRFNYEQPSQALKMICNAIGWDWYIDANLDVHFFPQNYNSAPFSIEDDNGKMISKSLEVNRDIVNLKNTIYVRGGYYSVSVDEADAFDKYEADGTQNTFPLVYRYKNVEATLDGTPLTVGVDYITDPTTVDVLYNYNEKLLKWPDASKPSAGEVVRVFGDAQVPLIVEAVDETSILAYGTFQHVIIDKSIESVQEAELQALAVMNDFASASHEGSFRTLENGLKAGQYITITSSMRGISGSFKITNVNARAYDSESFIYTVKFLKSGKVSFMDVLTDLLAEKRKNIVIGDDEVLERIILMPEELAIEDELDPIVTTSAPYTWQDPDESPEANPIVWNFFTWQ